MLCFLKISRIVFLKSRFFVLLLLFRNRFLYRLLYYHNKKSLFAYWGQRLGYAGRVWCYASSDLLMRLIGYSFKVHSFIHSNIKSSEYFVCTFINRIFLILTSCLAITRLLLDSYKRRKQRSSKITYLWSFVNNFLYIINCITRLPVYL